MRQTGLPLFAFCLILAGTSAARTEISAADCLSDDNERRIAGCSVMIENPATSPLDRSNALAMRGAAFTIKRMFDRAIEDYDASLRINPASPVTLNNRAWARLLFGRPVDALADVEEALRLKPDSQHARDTRAHIRLTQGLHDEALEDFLYAFEYGDGHMRNIYACGLIEAGIIPDMGEKARTKNETMNVDRRIEIAKGLAKCVRTPGCSPIPKDEKQC